MELPPEIESLPAIWKWAVTAGFFVAGVVIYIFERRKPVPKPPLIAEDIAIAIKTTEARAAAAEAEINRMRAEAVMDDLKQEIFGEIGRTRQMLRDLIAPVAEEIGELRKDVARILDRVGARRR